MTAEEIADCLNNATDALDETLFRALATREVWAVEDAAHVREVFLDHLGRVQALARFIPGLVMHTQRQTQAGPHSVEAA